MVEIKAYGKKELASLHLRFISIPVLSIPYLDKMFYTKTVWFSSPEEAKTKLATINPLIVFNQTGKYEDDSIRGFHEKIPPDWKHHTAIFVRAIQGLDANTWNGILSNILEPENMNFTFPWDFDYYSHPKIEAYKVKQDAQKKIQMSYDERERLEYITAHTPKKISFRRN